MAGLQNAISQSALLKDNFQMMLNIYSGLDVQAHMKSVRKKQLRLLQNFCIWQESILLC